MIMYFRHSNGIKDKFVEEFYNKLSYKVQRRCKFIGQCLRLAHHITGGVSQKNLNLCELKIKKESLKLFVQGNSSLFYGQGITRGLRNIANSIGLKESDIKFL